jgi:hypothetical protein
MAKTGHDELLAGLQRLRAALEATDQYPDTEGAHEDGDTVLTDALSLLAEHEPDAEVAVVIRAIAGRFTELRRDWWYA